MPPSALKTALEDLLKSRRLQAEGPPLRGQSRLSPLSTGLAEVDALLGGGFPRGQVSEIHGPASSGRTALALSTLTCSLRRGSLGAWVDPSDRFDPCSAAEAGLPLPRLLWLRGPVRTGLAGAVSAAGTLLGSGLFELVVLDLAGVAGPERARLPHTTWLRLQRGVEAGPGALLLIASTHVAHAPGGVSLSLEAGRARWSGCGPGRLLSGLDAEARSGLRRPGAAGFVLNV